MMFKRELARLIVEGKKTATRRRISDNPRSPWAEPAGMAHDRHWRYPVGKRFTVNPGRGVAHIAECEVTMRCIERLGDAGGTAARKEGFYSLLAFRDAWAKINGSFDLVERVHVVEFKLVGPDCMGCAGCGWFEGSRAQTCTDCYGTGVEPTPEARELIRQLERDAAAA